MASIIAVLDADADECTAARIRVAMSSFGGTAVLCRLGGRESSSVPVAHGSPSICVRPRALPRC